jgi:hypothetical protein
MAEQLFTQEEFNQMKEFLLGIKDFIPEDKGPYVWSTFQKISGDTSNRPCYCGSAANHWRRAVDTMRTYVSDNIDNYGV